MFAQPAALLFFVTKKLADGKPLERFSEAPLVRGDHAGQGGRELRAHGHGAFAFVHEMKKLIDNFGAALFFVKLRRLKNRPIPFDEAVLPRHLPPLCKGVIPRGAAGRQEIAKSGQRLHGSSGKVFGAHGDNTDHPFN